MHLIVDSGSTKSDWVLIGEGWRKEFNTVGLNPYFHDETSVHKAIMENDLLVAQSDNVDQIYFYGSGCSNEEMNQIIHGGLSQVFTSAKIVVDHDLKACALATYENEASISCILGTGSNSCFFDGSVLSEVVPSLGYVLGDEGSGAYFGKKLIRHYLYNELPEEISAFLKNQPGLHKEEIIRCVYKESGANTYLASFMKYIFEFSQSEFVKTMMFDGFQEFIRIHVCCFEQHKEVKTHFTGSIAFLFKEELKKACNALGVQLGQVIQKPIDGLVAYHSR